LGTTEEFKPIGYGKVSPTIEIISPENKTYSEVLLHFTINKVVEWTGYSIDEMANVSLNSQIKLTNLTQGTHSVKIFANDSRGNMGSSKTVVFSIDIQPPKIEIILPQNISYGTRDVQLTFTSDENLTSIYYSLDNQTKVPIVGNVTLVALPNGSHEITVFASDDWENSSQESINFEIAPIPTMTIVASIAIIIIVLSSGFIIIKHKKSPKEKKDLSSNSNEKL
jgi:hypothetical protein